MNVQINAAVLDLAVEAASAPEAQKEGRWVIFLIDKDGFVMDQQGEYLLPQAVRGSNTFIRVSGFGEESDASVAADSV